MILQLVATRERNEAADSFELIRIAKEGQIGSATGNGKA